MSRDWAKELEFTEEKIQKALGRIRRPTFFGELTLKSVGGKITDLKFLKTEKPDSPEE